MVKNLKKCLITVFDSSKEASGCTERNTKNPSSWRSMVSEKIKKYLYKNVFGGFSQKCYFFKGYSWFFPKPFFVKSWGFLHCGQCIRTLLLSYQRPFFDIFYNFYHEGDPGDLGRPKNWQHPQKWPKSENKSIFVNGPRIQMGHV